MWLSQEQIQPNTANTNLILILEIYTPNKILNTQQNNELNGII